MQIKKEEKKPRFTFSLQNVSKKRKRILVVTSAMLLSFIMFVSGVLVHKHHSDSMFIAKIRNAPVALYYLTKSLFVQSDVLAFHVNPRRMARLNHMRQVALNEGVQDFSYVTARLVHDGKTRRVDMRLKGDRRIHFEHRDKWSFRLRMKGNDRVMGMRFFSLHRPEARNYIYEWLFHRVLSREGIMHPRYMFVTVHMNGKNLGIYALEEHFSKELVLNNKRPDGPILHFREERADMPFQTTPIPYQSERWEKPGRKKTLEHATALLNSFINGEKKLSEVFETKRLATFFAVTDILGTHHAAIRKSMRLYYNPSIDRFEPIGYDGHYGFDRGLFIASEIPYDKKTGWFFQTSSGWFARFFQDTRQFDHRFHAEYTLALQRLSGSYYLENLLSELDDEIQRNLLVLYRDAPLFEDKVFSYGPHLFRFSTDGFYSRREYIRRTLAGISRHVEVFLREEKMPVASLQIRNLCPFPVIPQKYMSEKGIYVPGKEKIIITGNTENNERDRSKFTRVNFRFTGKKKDSGDMNSLFYFDIPGLDESMELEVNRWSVGNIPASSLPRPVSISELQRMKMFAVELAAKRIKILKGSWRLQKTLVIPGGYTVEAGPGAGIITGKYSILSYSPVLFRGSTEEPVRVTGTGRVGGLAVLQAGNSSLLEHVVFKNLSPPTFKSWSLTGAVTFYESPVTIKNCRFTGSQAEDSLNIARSGFEIRETEFANSRSDALDCDFSNGDISDCSFLDSGNDAIDIAGNNVSMKSINIQGAGDKGVSLGEGCTVHGEKIAILEANTGVACKDSSRAALLDVHLTGTMAGIAAYVKKAEFGPSRISVQKVTMSNVDVPYFVQEGSAIVVNGKRVPTTKGETVELLDEISR